MLTSEVLTFAIAIAFPMLALWFGLTIGLRRMPN